MIPAKFDYVRAGSADEAISLIAQYGEDAKFLAGGQSLLGGSEGGRVQSRQQSIHHFGVAASESNARCRRRPEHYPELGSMPLEIGTHFRELGWSAERRMHEVLTASVEARCIAPWCR